MLPVLWQLTLKFLNNMLYIPNDEMFVNKFVDVALPTKKQIFARTGQKSVSPSGSFTGEDSVHFKDTPTSGLARFVNDAEHYETPEKGESKK